MVDEPKSYIDKAVQSNTDGLEMIDRLISVAKPESSFGQPSMHGEYTLITATEVWAGAGYGFGMGGGSGMRPDEQPAVDVEGAETPPTSGEGGGGGGGGGSAARPVAIVSVGPNGVRVEPVVDVTKLGIAMFTTLGSMLFMLSRMVRRVRR